MRFAPILAALATITAVLAKEIPVTVGADNQLWFDPTNVTAEVGDELVFSFVSKNHTVTQSTFANPCTKVNDTGIDSSFRPFSANAAPPTFNVTVNGTDPLWFFCAQTSPVNHCAKGMVFAVNAPADKSFTDFQAKANSTGSGNGTSTGNSTASGTAPTTKPSSAAIAVGMNTASVLAAFGLVAGLAM
ncbi:hypothetical protein AMATHDRAFT_52972 [Amanita thiersii Skay4041]|uniref:Uncharacterized protein n=1 Tax=Amanita thiersii Skay4041 TaxID=703135 RepID=A0A2A9NT53_9AGAR|nr:hypothetical protein AMATHDRAFT_52972 [Amanita thiersii Skay4041]